MIATVASYTSATRIKRILSSTGIYVSVIQTPHALTKDGCGYSLKFDEAYKDDIKKAADELNINIRAFYAEKNISGQKKYIKMQGEEL